MKVNTKIYMILTLAAVVSCVKESHESGYKLSDVTFSVYADGVKSCLDDHSVVWTDGEDKVAIYDNVQGFISTPFTVISNSVSATVTEGATSFYSLYPYDAASSISGSVITTTLPAVQEATPDSFAPGANLSVAYTTISELSLAYRNVGALVQFTLDEDDVKSVAITGNNNEKISGRVSIDYNAGSPTVTASDVSVTLKHADGSTLKSGRTYYFIVAPVAFSRGITLTLTKTDGTFATRCTRGSVSFERNQFVKLGTIGSLPFGNDLYAAFNAGATIEIAGIGYNKADFSGVNEVQVLDSDTTPDIRSAVSGKKAIVFLSGAEDFTYSSSLIINKELVLVNRNPTSDVTLKPSRYSVFRGGTIVMKGIVFDATSVTDNYVFNNSGAESDFGKMHFDDCDLILSKNLFAINATGYGLSSIRFLNSNIRFSGSVQLVNAGQSPCMDVYKDVLFENNVVFSAGLNSFQVLNYANATNQTNSNDASCWSGNVSVKNNIFYNVQSPNGLFRHFRVASLRLGGNIYYSPATSGTSKTYYIFSSDQDKTGIKNDGDIIYGLNGGSWVYSGNPNGQPDGVVNTLSNQAENPFASFDAATGAYVLKDAYKSYGPQNK